METEGVLEGLLRDAEGELTRIRGQRADLDGAERLATEKVAHLRALIELETGPRREENGELHESTFVESVPKERGVPPTRTSGSASKMRPEDVAAEVLSERGPLHYRELWEEVARRGGNIVSGNPAAVLLTRISRDDRFAKDAGRGVYRLTVADTPTPTRKRRRRKARRRTTKQDAPAAPK